MNHGSERSEVGVSWAHRREHHGWTAEEIAILETGTRKAIAQTLNVSVHAVSRKRRSLGITSRIQRKNWSAEEIAVLGTAFDSEVGRLLGRSHVSVSNKRKTLRIPPFQAPPLRAGTGRTLPCSEPQRTL